MKKKNQFNWVIKLSLVLGFNLLLCACNINNTNKVDKFIEQVKTHEVKPIEPMPIFKRFQGYTLKNKSTRNPFQYPKLSGKSSLRSKVNANRPKEILEFLPLDSFKMVGTIEQNSVLWGLVKDKNNLLFKVNSGNYIGLNEGQIVQVLGDKLEVKETVYDPILGWKDRITFINLSQ